MYDYLIFIGRFQPFHNGHKHVVDHALTIANSVLIVCGTNGISAKNPWKYNEVAQMIKSCYDPHLLARIKIEPIKDCPSDQEWIASFRNIINQHTQGNIALIGHHKDQSSYYLDLLPELAYLEVANYNNINATEIRNLLTTLQPQKIKALVPLSVFRLLSSKNSSIFNICGV